MVPKRAANAAAFPVGTEVEVCNNTAGFKGSWYEAEIVRAIPRRRSYDVEYVSRVADDDPTQPLRKTVLATLVRPRRPRKVSSARYAVREHVDAYHNGGWRRGVVSALHGGDPPERYTVKFTGTKEEIEFSPAEIRPHLEWRHGRWCPPENQRRGLPSLTGKNPDLSSSPFPSSSGDLEQANPMCLKRKTSEQPDSEGQNEALVPKKVLKKGESLNPVGMDIDPKTPATDKEVLGGAPQSFEGPATESATSPENPLFDELGAEQRSVKGKTPATDKEVLVAPAAESATLQENPLFDVLGVEQRSAKGKSPIGLVVPGEKPSTTTEQVPRTQNVRHLFYNSLAGKVLPNKWGNIKVRSPREVVAVQVNTPATGEQRPQEVADLTGVEQHPSAEAKKRRGRPPKNSIDGAKKQKRRKPGDRVKVLGKNSGANLYKRRLVSYVSDNVSTPSLQVEGMPSASSPVAVAVAVKGRVEGRVEVMMPAISPVADKDVSNTAAMTTHDVASCTDTTTEGEVRVPPLPANVDPTPPLPANVDPTPIVSVPTKLPFRKTSALWGEIESLEVFQAIPQDPHFALVEKQSGRDFCEGMAIGLMVTFDNLVKDIRKLDVTDSNQAFEDRLGSLRMLEENGFSVECLRARIAELLKEKIMLSEIKNETTALKEKVLGASAEKEQIGINSFVVDKAIDEVKMHLARLNGKKQDLVTEDILKDVELADLEKQVGASAERYRSGVQRFRGIAAAPW